MSRQRGWRPSRGFAAALFGVAMTLLAWYGPWSWPAWPGLTAADLLFGPAGYDELPYAQRAAVLVGLIVLNVTFWSVAAGGVATLVAGVTARRGEIQR